MWIRLLLLVLIVSFCGPGTAFAQDDSARAIELISQANQHYDGGDFRAALATYREAYTITEDPRVLYRIGITYENLANYQRAREHLELYLLAEPESQYAGRVKAKINSLRTLEANLQAAVQVETQPPGAHVWVDIETGRPAGVTPVRLPLGPGSHTILLRKDGFTDIRDTFDIGAGESLERRYDLSSGGAVAEPTAEPIEAPVEQPIAKPGAEADPALYAGEPSRVRIGPSPGIAALSWISISLGWVLIVTSGVSTGLEGGDGGLIGTGFLAGAGLVALGSYFLWFRDYTRSLPPASAFNGSPPGQQVLGIGVRF